MQTFTEAKGKAEAMDPNKGNFHPFGVAIINHINRSAQEQGYLGGNLVWHGDEAGNPFSAGFDPADAPIFFIPGHSPIQVFSKEELLQLHAKLREHDFIAEATPLWD